VLADILIQSAVNGLVKIDGDEIYKFVEEQAKINDPFLSVNAVSILGWFDNERAVKTILSIAKKRDRRSFLMSVIALAGMCNQAASKALDELEVFVKEFNVRQKIQKTRKTFGEGMQQADWCKIKKYL